MEFIWGKGISRGFGTQFWCHLPLISPRREGIVQFCVRRTIIFLGFREWVRFIYDLKNTSNTSKKHHMDHKSHHNLMCIRSLKFTIDGKNDILGGRLNSDARQYKNTTIGRHFTRYLSFYFLWWFCVWFTRKSVIHASDLCVFVLHSYQKFFQSINI